MTKLRNNVLANFGGQAVAILIGIAFMPIYVRILGVESYGVIGFYVSLQAFFGILDLGLSATLNREFARHDISIGESNRRQDLLRTLECIYWPTGGVIAVATLLASQPLATHWLNPVGIGPAEAARAIALMGVATALQWPTALYEGGFRGLERQVSLNAMGAGFAICRAFGSVMVLTYISPTLTAFLVFQLAVNAIQTLTFRWTLWRQLPQALSQPRFSKELLRYVRSFTLGMAGIAALSFALMQSDRIILARLLPLDLFGYYTIAGTVSAAVSTISGSFFNAYFPRYSALVASKDEPALIHQYHHSSQHLAVVVASISAIIVHFSHDILLLWTRNHSIAENSGPILSVLIAGTAMNAIMHLPYALQLANGWTRLALWQNVVSVVVVVPATILAAQRYGSVGAAFIWVLLNAGYITFGVPLMHRRLLRQEMSAWYLRDIIPPFVAALVTAGMARHFLGPLPSGIGGLVQLGTACLLVLSCTALSSPTVRESVLRHARVGFRGR